MTLVRSTLTPDLDVLRAARNYVGKFPTLMETATKRYTSRFASRIRRELAQSAPPEQPERPFIWSYDPEAQRRARAWWAINVIQSGVPGGHYQRTGALVEAYEVTVENGKRRGEITLSNTAEGAEYVIGDEQVPSHYLTGWEHIDDTAARYQPEYTDGYIDVFLVTADPFAFIE